MSEQHSAESDAGCSYYAGCSEVARACGFCETHCLCGALPDYRDRRPIPPAETGGQ